MFFLSDRRINGILSKHINLKINCGVDYEPFSKINIFETITMRVCTNNTFEGYDPSYYVNVILANYNISSGAKSLHILFGSNSVSKNLLFFLFPIVLLIFT